MSNLLKLLMERATWANRLKMSNSLGKNSKKSYFSYVFVVFPPFLPKSSLLLLLFAQSLFFKEWPWANCSGCSEWKSYHEWFAPVSLYKSATVSNLLRSLMTKEWQQQFALFHERIALLLFCPQKKSESLEKPMSEVPTLDFRMCRKILEIFVEKHIQYL